MTTTTKIGIAGITTALIVWLAVKHHSSTAPLPPTTAPQQKPVAQGVASPDQLEQATTQRLKEIGVFCRMYAMKHNDVYPASFDQMQDLPTLAGNLHSGVGPDSFEFIDYGTQHLTDTTPQSILAREKQSRQMPNGTWHRAYLLADGSVQGAISPDGNFDAWEKDPNHHAAIP